MIDHKSTICVAPELTIDADYFGAGTWAMLAKKGAGKSYTSRVLAEEMWDAQVPFVLFDPMGACWGLRSSADGESEGIPVAIFGGKHGDAPLERTSGRIMADLVMNEGLSMVLDFSEFGSHAAEREFANAFLDRLYFHNERLVHLLIDEADLFAPQKPPKGAEALLGVMDNVVRRGRNRGIGVTLMTQRPAVLNKDVLTQIDGLIAMRVIGLPDREAVNEWVKGHGEDPEAAATVRGSLASLSNGESWWWVPELGILKRIQIRETRTFDSSPSRKRDQVQRQPKGFADVDMSAIGAQIEATIERARAEDPKELRATIASLRRELASRASLEPRVVEVVKEVPTIPSELVDVANQVIEIVRQQAAKLRLVADVQEDATDRLARSLDILPIAIDHPVARSSVLDSRPTVEQDRNGSGPPGDDMALGVAARDILAAVAAFDGGLTISQISLLTGRRARGGSWNTAMKQVRSGYVSEEGDRLVITTTGHQQVPDAVPLTRSQIIERWRSSFPAPARDLLDQMLASPDYQFELAELAELTGKVPRGGSWNTAVKALRDSGLVVSDGTRMRLNVDLAMAADSS